MKKVLLTFFIAFLFLPGFAQISYPSLNINFMSKIDPETDATGSDGRKYSGCWGWYQANKKREYALVGTSRQTYFIDITNPYQPKVKDSVLARHTGCTWRELKTYQHYCYVTSDACKPNSLQIIDMQYLPDSVHVVYNDTTLFKRGHTLWVDGNKLYVGGPTLPDDSQRSMQVYSLANPESPVLLRTLSDDFPSLPYVHDMYVRNDTVYASTGWDGLQVFKFNSSTNTFSILGSFTGYNESGYNHSSSLTPDGKTLVFCDEVPSNLSIKVADVSNLSNISLSALTRPNMDVNFVAHNPYVFNNQWVFVSAYQDGLLLYDISNPLSPQLMGYFDTYPQGGSGFITNYGGTSYRGNWGAYCYFPSGVILACDMQNGVFLLEANNLLGTSAGIIETIEKPMIPIIYPNPTNSNINISFMPGNSKNCTIEIVNVLGQIVYSEAFESTYPITHKTIDISDHDAGTYILTIQADKNVNHQKFIITR